MRRTASEVIRHLEMRVARLERQAGPADQYYLDQYSRQEQERGEKSEAKRRKMEGPSAEEMLYGLMASEYGMEIDMLSSGGNASIKVPVPSFAMNDEDALVSYLNLKAKSYVFGIHRNKITVKYKPEKFTLSFDYKLDRNSGSVVIYSGRSLH